MSLQGKVTKKTVPVFILTILMIVFSNATLASFLAGLIFIVPGEAIRVWACGHLQKNMKVTTSGPYAYVKNPLYLGTILIMIGFCITAGNYYVMGIGVTVFLFYYVPFKKNAEGSRLHKLFGDAWLKYDENVPDYIPRLTPYSNRDSHRFDFSLVKKNSEWGTLLVTLVGLVVFAVKIVSL